MGLYDLKPLQRGAVGFRLKICDEVVELVKYEGLAGDPLPTVDLGLEPDKTAFYQRLSLSPTALATPAASPHGLFLPYRRPDSTKTASELVLAGMPSLYELTALRQAGSKWPKFPFFYQDRTRTFFVSQQVDPPGYRPKWTMVDGVGLDARFSDLRVWSDIEFSTTTDFGTAPSITPKRTPDAKQVGPAPSRLLLAVGSTSEGVGAPFVADETPGLVVDLRYLTGSGVVAVGGGSASARVDVVSYAIEVPSPVVTSPSPVSVPAKHLPVNRYLFQPFYHPYVCNVVRQLHRYGIDGLLDPLPGLDKGIRRQTLRNDDFFATKYLPQEPVAFPFPIDEFDFSYSGAYSAYNWELFFHVPILIAKRLVADRRYEQALRWFHAVFHPMERTVATERWPERVWKIRPFFEAGRLYAVDDLLGLLSYEGTDPKIRAAKKAVEDQVADWRANPFEPHRLARLRSGTYQRWVVIEYVKALIAWGDTLFRRETLEALNEAIQIYVLAAKILGRRPEKVTRPPPAAGPTVHSFRTLTAPGSPALDAFSDALVKLETAIKESDIEVDYGAPTDMPASESLVFCVPPNEKLTELWDLVADRLFKLRHCMNIDGVVRQLPLFEPPIDPALLVRASAAGIDISSVLNDLSGPLPLRRFRVLVMKAQEICNDVRSLGAALLSALEKQDAEELGQLRQGHERSVLEATRAARQQTLKESETTLGALESSARAAAARFEYYSTIPRTIPEEDESQAATEEAGILQLSAQIQNAIGSVLGLIPQFHASPTSPSVETGGKMLRDYYGAWASIFSALSANKQLDAQRAGHQAMVRRRDAEWRLQAAIAKADTEQIAKQILAQQIRIALARIELDVLDRQIDNAKKMEERLRTKYTNQELYGWMIEQTSDVYLASYTLAYDLAKQAERAFQFERADLGRSFVKFGSWENLRKGLLAGERLAHDLRTMEVAFLAEDRRELELTRNVSLAELNPWALIKLRETGVCDFEIPESFFDAETPGHYLRRLRSVSLTIPSVTGPYVPVRCTLTLLSSKIRRSTKAPVSPPSADPELVQSAVSIQSVVTSHGREDGGVFDNDPRDERYMPFEGAGVVGRFRLELPKRFPNFDHRTIQDAVLHLRYTARDGGSTFRAVIENKLLSSSGGDLTLTTLDDSKVAPGPMAALVSVRAELPDAWYSLFNPPSGWTEVTITVPFEKSRLPAMIDGHTVRILSVAIVAVMKAPYPTNGLKFQKVKLDGTDIGTDIPLATNSAYGSLPTAVMNLVAPERLLGATGFTVKLKKNDIDNALTEGSGPNKKLKESAFQDFLVVVRYAFKQGT